MRSTAERTSCEEEEEATRRQVRGERGEQGRGTGRDGAESGQQLGDHLCQLRGGAAGGFEGRTGGAHLEVGEAQLHGLVSETLERRQLRRALKQLCKLAAARKQPALARELSCDFLALGKA